MQATVGITPFIPLLALLAFTAGGCSKPTPVQSLIDAACRGDVAKCEQLVKSGVPVDGTDGNGDTALDWAIYYRHIDVVRKLIELGADVNHTDHAPGYTRGFTPLMYVARPFRGKGYYPETMAARNQIAQLLIQYGADVNRATSIDKGIIGGGDTALHFAVEDQNPQLIRMLLTAGANKNARNQQGYTPMDEAKFPDYANTAVINALEGK